MALISFPFELSNESTRSANTLIAQTLGSVGFNGVGSFIISGSGSYTCPSAKKALVIITLGWDIYNQTTFAPASIESYTTMEMLTAGQVLAFSQYFEHIGNNPYNNNASQSYTKNGASRHSKTYTSGSGTARQTCKFTLSYQAIEFPE